MTNQEAYEKMRAWLGREGAEKCMVVGNCVYYQPINGNRCAIGALLSQELAESLMHYSGDVQDLIDTRPAAEDELAGLDINFLSDAQNVHDTYPQEEWLNALDKTAEHYGLYVVQA